VWAAPRHTGFPPQSERTGSPTLPQWATLRHTGPEYTGQWLPPQPERMPELGGLMDHVDHVPTQAAPPVGGGGTLQASPRTLFPQGMGMRTGFPTQGVGMRTGSPTQFPPGMSATMAATTYIPQPPDPQFDLRRLVAGVHGFGEDAQWPSAHPRVKALMLRLGSWGLYPGALVQYCGTRQLSPQQTRGVHRPKLTEHTSASHITQGSSVRPSVNRAGDFARGVGTLITAHPLTHEVGSTLSHYHPSGHSCFMHPEPGTDPSEALLRAMSLHSAELVADGVIPPDLNPFGVGGLIAQGQITKCVPHTAFFEVLMLLLVVSLAYGEEPQGAPYQALADAFTRATAKLDSSRLRQLPIQPASSSFPALPAADWLALLDYLERAGESVQRRRLFQLPWREVLSQGPPEAVFDSALVPVAEVIKALPAGGAPF
jgi:hypothetical protein